MSHTEELTRRENRKLIGEHLKRADKFLKAGEFEKASDEVERALSLDPKNEYVFAYKERVVEMQQESGTKTLVGGRTRVAVEEEARESRLAQEETRNAEFQVIGRVETRDRKLRQDHERRRREEGDRRRAVELSGREAHEHRLASLLNEAEELLRMEQFDQARGLVEKAFELDPKDPRPPNLYTRIREAKLTAQKRKEQEEEKHQAAQKKIHVHVERIKNYLATGKLEKALDAVSEAYSIDSANAEIKLLEQKTQRAIEEKRKAKEEEERRKQEEALLRLEEEARRRREEEERGRLEEERRRLAEEEARRLEKLRRIAEYLEDARDYLRKEKFRKALDELENVYLLEPGNVEANQLGEEVKLREEEKRRAEEEARRRAEEEERLRRKEEERRKLEKRIRGYIENAQIDVEKGKLDRALAEASNAYMLDPVNQEVKQFIERIEKTIEERTKTEEAQRRAEEEARRKREEAERRQRLEEERLRAQEEVKRQALLRRINSHLEKALEETALMHALDPSNPTAEELEEALKRMLVQVEPRATVASQRSRAEAYAGRVFEEKKAPAIQAAARAEKTKRPVHLVSKKRFKKGYILASLVVVLLVGAFVVSKGQVGLFSEHKVILVLPLKLSSDNGQESYLSEALTATFINDLSTVSDLFVFNEGTSFALWQSSNAISLGKQLRATHVLHGTLEKAGASLALRLEVDEAFSGKRVWSEKFLTSTVNLKDVRKSIVSGTLQSLRLDPEQALKFTEDEATGDTEALDLYWRGLARLFGYKGEDAGVAIQYFDQALKRDPKFALALAGKGAAMLKMYEREWKNDPQLLQQTKELGRRALNINGHIALAHRTLGVVYQYEKKYTKALEEIREALALEPNDASAYRALALVHATKGDLQGAVEASSKALKLDPLNYESYVVRGIVKHMAGDYAEASSAYEQGIGIEPGIAWDLNGLLDNALLSQASQRRALSLYQIYLQLYPNDYTMLYKVGRANQIDGKIQAAQPYFQQVIDLSQQELRGNPKSAKAYIYIALAQTRMGRYKEAQEIAKRAISIAPQEPQVLYGMAYMLSMQNNIQGAFEWLQKATSVRYSYRGILDFDLFNIRALPDFTSILERVE